MWLSRDPAGFVDGPNLYAYVMQNPWTKFDPEGLETKLELEDASTRLESGYKEQRKDIETMGDISSGDRENGLNSLEERYDKSKKDIGNRIDKIEKTAKDMSQIYGGNPEDYYQQRDDSQENVRELIRQLEHAEKHGVRNGLVDTLAGDYTSGAVTVAKGIMIDRVLRRIPVVGSWLKKRGSELHASLGGKRRKPGSLGKFKGTDALRRENGTPRDAANAAGLDQDQARRLHKEISGQGYSYEEILEIAKQLKGKGD